jgi:hypothetical protein
MDVQNVCDDVLASLEEISEKRLCTNPFSGQNVVLSVTYVRYVFPLPSFLEAQQDSCQQGEEGRERSTVDQR